jgi:hypothetical protein
MPHPTTTVGTDKTKEGAMDNINFMLLAKQAVLAIGEIKAATETFDRGDTNVFDALDAVRIAVEAYADCEDRKREAA